MILLRHLTVTPRFSRLCVNQQVTKRFTATARTLPSSDHFTFLPGFLSLAEQRIVLNAALAKLDGAESIQNRRRRRKALAAAQAASIEFPTASNPLRDLFLPDEYYGFEEGHFDGVIKHFREMHLTSWPADVPELKPILERLYALFPTEDVQTHLLHLSSRGEIHPHVDNISASGSVIMGLSLGCQRVLVFENEQDRFEIMLPSGSVYLQRDDVRFNYKHSILVGETRAGDDGQRVSVIFRDRLET